MQPAYYENFSEIKKKIWLMLEDAISNRNSQFRIPTFICGFNNIIYYFFVPSTFATGSEIASLSNVNLIASVADLVLK